METQRAVTRLNGILYRGIMDLQRNLSRFNGTNILVGSVIGADNYLASAITAGLPGPFSLIIWIIAGICAKVIAPECPVSPPVRQCLHDRVSCHT
jgi:hypothetical protein